MSGLHADALRTLTEWIAADPEQESLRTAYVAHLRAHPDAHTRSCRPDHLTASTLVLDEQGERVLLTLHAKAGAWFQFGGHLEDVDSTLAGAALREATEESGLTGLLVDPVPVQLDSHDVPFCSTPGQRSVTRHLDVRFLGVAPADGSHQISEESLDVRWWPVDALPTAEESLHRLVELGLHRLRTRVV